MTGTDETWAGINYALKQGKRGLHGNISLVKPLAAHRHHDCPSAPKIPATDSHIGRIAEP